MFSINKAAFFFATLFVSFNLTQAANQLCRTCLNGKVTFGLESDTHGSIIIQANGDCEHPNVIKTPDGVTFADFGNDSHEFAVVPSDYTWVFLCDLGTQTTGCCDLA
jgi:hypothetical protein